MTKHGVLVFRIVRRANLVSVILVSDEKLPHLLPYNKVAEYPVPSKSSFSVQQFGSFNLKSTLKTHRIAVLLHSLFCRLRLVCSDYT